MSNAKRKEKIAEKKQEHKESIDYAKLAVAQEKAQLSAMKAKLASQQSLAPEDYSRAGQIQGLAGGTGTGSGGDAYLMGGGFVKPTGYNPIGPPPAVDQSLYQSPEQYESDIEIAEDLDLLAKKETKNEYYQSYTNVEGFAKDVYESTGKNVNQLDMSDPDQRALRENYEDLLMDFKMKQENLTASYDTSKQLIQDHAGEASFAEASQASDGATNVMRAIYEGTHFKDSKTFNDSIRNNLTLTSDYKAAQERIDGEESRLTNEMTRLQEELLNNDNLTQEERAMKTQEIEDYQAAISNLGTTSRNLELEKLAQKRKEHDYNSGKTKEYIDIYPSLVDMQRHGGISKLAGVSDDAIVYTREGIEFTRSDGTTGTIKLKDKGSPEAVFVALQKEGFFKGITWEQAQKGVQKSDHYVNGKYLFNDDQNWQYQPVNEKFDALKNAIENPNSLGDKITWEVKDSDGKTVTKESTLIDMLAQKLKGQTFMSTGLSQVSGRKSTSQGDSETKETVGTGYKTKTSKREVTEVMKVAQGESKVMIKNMIDGLTDEQRARYTELDENAWSDVKTLDGQDYDINNKDITKGEWVSITTKGEGSDGGVETRYYDLNNKQDASELDAMLERDSDLAVATENGYYQKVHTGDPSFDVEYNEDGLDKFGNPVPKKGTPYRPFGYTEPAEESGVEKTSNKPIPNNINELAKQRTREINGRKQ